MAIGMTKVKNTSIMAAESIAVDSLEWASDAGNVIDLTTAEQAVDCMLQIQIAFLTSSSLDAELHLRYSQDSGGTEDTPEVKTFATTIANVPNTTQIISYRIPGGFDYLDVGIKNLEAATYTITATIDATYTKLTGLTAA